MVKLEKKVKVKKEEPSFEQDSGFLDDGSGGASYGLLDGIEKFGGGVGGGRSAATGYRKSVA